MALSGHAQRADERPLLGAKRKLTNGCLPISIMSTGASRLARLDCLLCRDPRRVEGPLCNRLQSGTPGGGNTPRTSDWVRSGAPIRGYPVVLVCPDFPIAIFQYVIAELWSIA